MTKGYHLSTTPEHYTPLWLCKIAHYPFDGPPDLDPASCEAANSTVGASRYYSLAERGEDGSALPWGDESFIFGARIFINPPSGGRNLPRRFWERALEAHWAGASIFWVGFNLGQLSTLQAVGESPLDHLTCILRRRIEFDSLGRVGASKTVWSEARALAKREEEKRRHGGEKAAYSAILKELLKEPLVRVCGDSPAMNNYVTLLTRCEYQKARFIERLEPLGVIVNK